MQRCARLAAPPLHGHTGCPTLRTHTLELNWSQLAHAGTLYDSPRLLARLPAAEVLAYFGKCWRGGSWRELVTNAMPHVCVRAWLAAGFRKEQFLLVPSARLRTVEAGALVSALANFTGLHLNQEALARKDKEFRTQCEAPDAAQRRARARAKAADGVTATDAAAAAAADPLRITRSADGAAAPKPGEKVMVNTHSTYTGHDAVRRTQLAPELRAELSRLLGAHVSMLEALGLPELSP